MRPVIKIDINQAIANTRFIQDLSTVLYGAEFALKRVNATEAQISEVLDGIVQNTFSSLEFNFDSISSNSFSREPQSLAFESYQPAPVDNEPHYTGMTNTYSVAASDIDYDFFDDNPLKNADQRQLYRMSDKTYDSRMDEDEDLERPANLPAQSK